VLGGYFAITYKSSAKYLADNIATRRILLYTHMLLVLRHKTVYIIATYYIRQEPCSIFGFKVSSVQVALSDLPCRSARQWMFD
jgi:hypothetical protein